MINVFFEFYRREKYIPNGIEYLTFFPRILSEINKNS